MNFSECQLPPIAAHGHGHDSMCRDDNPFWLDRDRHAITARALSFLNSITLQGDPDTSRYSSSRNNYSADTSPQLTSHYPFLEIDKPQLHTTTPNTNKALEVHFQEQPIPLHTPPTLSTTLTLPTTTSSASSSLITTTVPPSTSHEAISHYFIFPNSAPTPRAPLSSTTNLLTSGISSSSIASSSSGIADSLSNLHVGHYSPSRRPSVSRNIAPGCYMPRGFSEPSSTRQPSANHLFKRQLARRKAAVDFLSSITFGTKPDSTPPAIASGVNAIKSVLSGDPIEPTWERHDPTLTPIAPASYPHSSTIPMLVIPPAAFNDGIMTSKALSLDSRGSGQSGEHFSSPTSETGNDLKSGEDKTIGEGHLLPDFSHHGVERSRGKSHHSKANTVKGGGRRSRRTSLSPRSEKPRSRKNSGHGDDMPPGAPELITIFSSVEGETLKTKYTQNFASPPFLTRAATYPAQAPPGHDEEGEEFGSRPHAQQQPTFTKPPHIRARVKEWEKSLIDKGLLNSRIYICNKFQSIPMICSSVLTFDHKTENEDDAHPIPFEKTDGNKYGTVTRSGISYADMLPPRDFYGPLEDDNYDPYYLDDHTIQSGKHRVVLNLPGMMASVISFVKEKDLRGELNQMFRSKHEWLRPELTLSKIMKCKELLLSVGADLRLELSTVAVAYVYFEKLVLQDVVTKFNRKLCAGSCILLAFKYNEDTVLAVQKFKETKQIVHVPKNMSLVEWKRKQRLKQVFNSIEKFLYVKKTDLMKNEFRLLLFLGLTASLEPDKVLPHYNYLKQHLDVTDQSHKFD